MSKGCGRKIKKMQQIFENMWQMRAKVAAIVSRHTAIQIS